MKFGEQTKDEMAFAFVNFVSPFGDIGIPNREAINRIRDALSGRGPLPPIPPKPDDKKPDEKKK